MTDSPDEQIQTDMPVLFMTLPFRIGTTSYIVPDNLIANARYLADKVQDMQLVLFDLDGGPSNFPSPEEISELASWAQEQGLNYSVHLPVDLRLGENGDPRHTSLVKAQDVICRTRPLKPWVYVAHLDGRTVKHGASPEQFSRWVDQSMDALRQVIEWVGDPRRVAVENLDTYPPMFFDPVIDQLPVSRCVDVGHLWLDGHDPLPFLRRVLPETRIVHLHGVVDGHDHQSLAHVPEAQLKAILDLLLSEQFNGVLTLEVFGEEDFWGSLDALQKVLSLDGNSDKICTKVDSGRINAC